jgi:hypothetical protein
LPLSPRGERFFSSKPDTAGRKAWSPASWRADATTPQGRVFIIALPSICNDLQKDRLDCFVARTPRNDELAAFRRPINVIASEAKQSSGDACRSDCFVARTPRNDELAAIAALSTSLRAKRSNPAATQCRLDCFVVRAPRNDELPGGNGAIVASVRRDANMAIMTIRHNGQGFEARVKASDTDSAWCID